MRTAISAIIGAVGLATLSLAANAATLPAGPPPADSGNIVLAQYYYAPQYQVAPGYGFPYYASPYGGQYYGGQCAAGWRWDPAHYNRWSQWQAGRCIPY